MASFCKKERVKFNYKKLRDIVAKKYGSHWIKKVSIDTDNNCFVMWLKFHGKIYFSLMDIDRLTKILNFSEKDIKKYFFNPKGTTNVCK